MTRNSRGLRVGRDQNLWDVRRRWFTEARETGMIARGGTWRQHWDANKKWADQWAKTSAKAFGFSDQGRRRIRDSYLAGLRAGLNQNPTLRRRRK